MAVILKEWNILDHLKTEEDMALYLRACFADAGDDVDFIAKALCDVAQAKHLAVQAEMKTDKPSFDAVCHLIKSLGLELHVTPAKRAVL